MIDFYLSSDGKHTVHVSVDTPEELNRLAPQAMALYDAVVNNYGNKAQMWQSVVNGKANGNGTAKVGMRINTVEQANEAVAPRCPMHNRPMRLRQGRLGPFWSCPERKPDGRWCQVTKDASEEADQASG